MLTRRFGKTDLRPTVLTFGAMRIPPEADEDPHAARDRAFATMRRALDVGINHIETARGYGPSEELIGAALAEGVIRRDEFILTTKIAPMETRDAFREALDDSLRRMNVDRIDNLDIHGINTRELLAMATRADGTMGAVRRAMDERIVGHLGFATHAPLEVILEAIETDEFESVNLHYYMLNRRNRPAVERAAGKDMGVFIISPSDKGGQLFHPPQKLQDLCKPFTPIELNQRWLLAQPEVHTLSLGAARPEEFDAHLLGVNRDGPLSADESAAVARLDGALAELGSTYCSFCHECLPCPEDVHIPEILRLRNLALAYDMKDFGRYRYGMFVRHDAETGERTGGAGHWFPGTQGDFCTRCGECLPRCPLNLPIPDLLAETHELLSGRAGKRLWK
ncbi:MAG: aldo/keto reductase [Chthonomonadales bacterium]|nr:aldo/keto reductase [Chthonomonadales bacterium]